MFTGVVIGFICFHLSEALQCYNCGSLLDPNSCHHHVTCATNQMCRASRSPNANNQYVYSFGCLDKMVCQAISSTNVIGRRSQLASLTTCCETDLCNINSKNSDSSVGESMTYNVKILNFVSRRRTRTYRFQETLTTTVKKTWETAKESPLKGTTPTSTSVATIDPNVCANSPGVMCDNRLVCTVSSTANLCRKTCGLCSGASYTKTSTSAAITLDLRTTMTAGVCSDYPGIGCDNHLVCTVSSTAQLCKKSCGLCSGVPTVATCKSHDPIQECRCKYLDKAMHICAESETDRTLNKYCCYYCNKKKGNQRCPDAFCDRIEKQEHALVDALTTSITCTH